MFTSIVLKHNYHSPLKGCIFPYWSLVQLNTATSKVWRNFLPRGITSLLVFLLFMPFLISFCSIVRKVICVYATALKALQSKRQSMQWIMDWVTEWQCHLLSCPWQIKRNIYKEYIWQLSPKQKVDQIFKRFNIRSLGRVRRKSLLQSILNGWCGKHETWNSTTWMISKDSFFFFNRTSTAFMDLISLMKVEDLK